MCGFFVRREAHPTTSSVLQWSQIRSEQIESVRLGPRDTPRFRVKPPEYDDVAIGRRRFTVRQAPVGRLGQW
ncbi:hypothetical protein AArcCO_2742 [Halalkaliarchaeum sp. AArc-CO]|nr:hypothetical protein AArcCO_2742 [Halalkaliarchaeum sp. AArc-CO]